MTYSRYLRLAAICGSALFGACAGDSAKAPPGTTVTVQAAPISYPGVTDVCYGLTVYNGQPGAPGTDTVWSQDQICSSAFGNSEGGDISYVGPCDASTGDNYVALTLETIQVDGGTILDDQITSAGLGDGDADFQNPCTADARCQLHFLCKENQDVAVTFNLTVMRDADQGFFDIAVNFDDVFCSAKVDSCTALDAPITLLFGDDVHDRPGRDLTTVAAVACTAGPDVPGRNFDTDLLFTSKTVSCDGGVSFTLDPVGEAGGNLTATADNGNYTLRYAHTFGAEELSCGQMQQTDSNGVLYFSCPEGTCTIVGFAPPNGLGYGGAAAAAAGGYGGYGAQGSQGSQGAAAQGSQRSSGYGYGGYGGYGGYAQAAGVTLQYFADGTEIFPELDSNGEPILPDWFAIMVPLSCNKAYYTTSIDVENLVGQGLSGCTLSFHATALASDDTTTGFDSSSGTFARQGGLYGAIDVADVPLIEGDGNGGFRPTCNANPLDGTDLYGNPSQVKTQYVGTLAPENPAFCFHSDNGNPLGHFDGCGVTPTDCPINCTSCQPWGDNVSLTCVPQGLGHIVCSGHGADPNTTLTLFGLGGYGDPTIGSFDSDANGDFVSPAYSADANGGAVFVVSQNGAVLVSTEQQCTGCPPDTQLNELGFCSQAPPPQCELANCSYCPNGTTCAQCVNPNYVLDENGQCVLVPLCDEAAHCRVCGDWGDVSLVCDFDGDGNFRCDLKGGPADTDVALFATNGYESQFGTTDSSGGIGWIIPGGDNVDGEFFYLVDQNTYEVYATTLPLRCLTCAPGYFSNSVGLCVQGGGGA